MDWPLFLIGTSETWRKGRKLLDGSLRPGAVMPYRQMMQEKTHELLTRLLTTPKDFHPHIELLVLVIFLILYDY
jgi:cytochrome P450